MQNDQVTDYRTQTTGITEEQLYSGMFSSSLQ
jgi:hypothetical protein